MGGGALQAEGASREWGGEYERGVDPPLIRGGYGGPPPEFFKNLSL